MRKKENVYRKIFNEQCNRNFDLLVESALKTMFAVNIYRLTVRSAAELCCKKKQASETAFPMPAAHNIKKKKLFLRDFGVAFVEQGDDFARDVVCRIDEKRAVFI